MKPSLCLGLAAVLLFSCKKDDTDPNGLPGVYLLVLHRADGQRQVQRVAVR